MGKLTQLTEFSDDMVNWTDHGSININSMVPERLSGQFLPAESTKI